MRVDEVSPAFSSALTGTEDLLFDFRPRSTVQFAQAPWGMFSYVFGNWSNFFFVLSLLIFACRSFGDVSLVECFIALGLKIVRYRGTCFIFWARKLSLEPRGRPVGYPPLEWGVISSAIF